MLQPLQYHKGFMCKPAGEMAQWNGPPFGTTKVACANQLVSRFGMVPFCTTKFSCSNPVVSRFGTATFGPQRLMFKPAGEQVKALLCVLCLGLDSVHNP
jgi:hypothetical protein